MNKFLQSIAYTSFALAACVSASSCSQDEPPVPESPERTVLIYAVASNSLSSDLQLDKNEMLAAAPSVAGLGKKVRVLVYEVASTSTDHCTLSELKMNSAGEWDFSGIKTYDRDTFSTDPARMSQVFSDVASISPSDSYGLIFWSHGTGWIPNFADHQVAASQTSSKAIQKSFGYDKYNGIVDYCDVDELASAIPSGMFDYIWFDCCYMMCIETAYQLRDKCEYICGYPTEDWDTGMNYDATLPLLARRTPDLTGAAESFFKYYEAKNLAATVTVASTAGLSSLADVCRRIYSAGTVPSYANLQNYSRLGYGLYDFGQYTERYLEWSPERDSLLSEFNEALGKVVKYGACSDFDFNRKPLDPAVYSGFSCHYPGLMTSSAQEDFYNSLDWPRSVYK